MKRLHFKDTLNSASDASDVDLTVILTPRRMKLLQEQNDTPRDKCVVIHVKYARDVDLSEINGVVGLVVGIKIFCGMSYTPAYVFTILTGSADRYRCTQSLQTAVAHGSTANHPQWDERIILSLVREDMADLCFIQFELKDTALKTKPSFGICRTPNLKTLKNKECTSFPFILSENADDETTLHVNVEVRGLSDRRSPTTSA